MADHYDIAIVGMGCAGSHVALELLRQQVDKRIVVIDNYEGKSLEKTWSFWENGAGYYDHVLINSWRQGVFRAQGKTINLDLGDYVYKSVDSSDFIAFAKAELQKSPNFTFIDARVNNVEYTDPRDSESKLNVDFSIGTLTASVVLDSRMPRDFRGDKQATTLLQHFKGWVIETEEDCFNPSSFVMMDYNLKDEGTTSFFYVLPYSKKKALVEFTYFSHEVVEDNVYDNFLKEYIASLLKIDHYLVGSVEKGVIPMTSYDFTRHNKPNHLKIGTAGGWVKPSTGYSFKLSEFKAKQLVQNIVNGNALAYKLFSKRHFIYDITLLEVLGKYNAQGDELFLKLYSRNPAYRLFDFLDDQSSYSQELKIMKSMTSMRFVNGFFKTIINGITQ
jgi:lycopene beta-cyclase